MFYFVLTGIEPLRGLIHLFPHARNRRTLPHVGRSFDGLHYQYAKGNRNFTAVSAVPTRGVFQVDGWGWNQAAFGYGALTQMWGKGTHAADTRVFGLYYHDFRDVLKTDNRPLAVRQADVFSDVKIFTFGGHSVHAFTAKAATYDLLFWGAGQTGGLLAEELG